MKRVLALAVKNIDALAHMDIENRAKNILRFVFIRFACKRLASKVTVAPDNVAIASTAPFHIT